jgi:hypothetical protein
MSEVRDPPLLVLQVQSEQQHGDDHPDRQRRSITQVTELPNQQRQAGATQDAVDGSDRAGAGEQRLRRRGPQPNGGHRRLVLRIGLGRVEELAGLGDQAAVVAADALRLPQQHQVLHGVAQQGGEGELTEQEQRGQHRGHERVQPGDHLG